MDSILLIRLDPEYRLSDRFSEEFGEIVLFQIDSRTVIRLF